MKVQPLAIFFAFLLVLAGCKSSGRGTGAPGHGAAESRARSAGSGFDFYLLNLSWSPEFCYSHPEAAECAEHAGFVLHGLWPENADGTYPEHCSNAPGPPDPSAYRDIYPDAGLLDHEWQTHGTCSGLDADGFFSTARHAVQSIAIPPRFRTLRGSVSLSPDQVLDSFSVSNPAVPERSFVVSCGHNYLTSVEVCLDKSLNPIVCPSAIHSCRANVLRIAPP